MKILVIGGGGREHALVWKLKQSRKEKKIWCAPRNVGIATLAECVPIPATDITGLAEFARANKMDLTVVGPEAPLALGITDSFKRLGLKIFGPSKEAAALESSKIFAKEFCLRHGIPTARSESFSDLEPALVYVRTQPLPIVIKANGLAAGKGVVICQELKEAETAIVQMMSGESLGVAGKRVLIEEYLEGEEASFMAICDGNHLLPLVSSQDHKRLLDGDLGPNTGGMGAISPAAVISNGVATRVMEEIMLPAARGMVTEGAPFVGVLYAGLMVSGSDIRLLEFNVRFGDPEAQTLLVRLKTDLVDVLNAAVTGSLDRVSLEWDARPSACVVMASGGYPGAYEKGFVIHGIPEAGALRDVVVFHSGTKAEGRDIVTNGGRVLSVTAIGEIGENREKAISRSYEAVSMISWKDACFRKDIGYKSYSNSEVRDEPSKRTYNDGQ